MDVIVFQCIPLSHISDAVYKTSADWINQRSPEALGFFVLWSLDIILEDLVAEQESAKGSKQDMQQTSSKSEATERFEAIYPTIKEVALVGSHGSKAMRKVSQQILIFAVKAAGESALELSKEAAGVVIWCLNENADCCRQIKDPNSRKAASFLPPITLFHGTSDYSIPSNASINFVDALKAVGVEAELILYQGKSHTDLFLQQHHPASNSLFPAPYSSPTSSYSALQPDQPPAEPLTHPLPSRSLPYPMMQ
ncbi:hypothetical protein REPUB_Repub14bG0039200 [Reevesia pubescens]